MKKLLFIIFFPITLPIYLIHRFFEWLSDTFIPFVQYNVIPFLSDTLFPAIKKFINYIKEKSAEKEIKQNSESITTHSANTQTKNPTMENDSDINLKSCSNETENIPQTAEIKEDNYSQAEKSIILYDYDVDKPDSYVSHVTVSVQDSGITVTGHLPPYTNKEYRKIRHSETLNQIYRLKKYHNLNSFESCYGSAKVYEIWGAKYRLLAIKCYEKCLKYTPAVPITNIYSALAVLYEKSHQFEKAVNILQKHIDESPEHSSAYTHKSICLVKLGKIDEAIDMLNAVKETDYYKNPNPSIDPSFTTCIDRKLEDCLNKKERGYKFKPRKNTFDYIDPDNFSLNEICNEYLQKWS